MPKKGEKMTAEQIAARAEARARNRAKGVNAKGERLKAAKAEVKRVTSIGLTGKTKKMKRPKKGKLIPFDAIPDDRPQKRQAKKVKFTRHSNPDSMELKLLRTGLMALEMLAEMMEKK